MRRVRDPNRLTHREYTMLWWFAMGDAVLIGLVIASGLLLGPSHFSTALVGIALLLAWGETGRAAQR